MDPFRDRVAVITGGGGGIGSALARAFAARGARLALADVDRNAAEAVAKELAAGGAEAEAFAVDVTDKDDVERLAGAVVGRFGKVHVVCNNAGVMIGGLSWEAPLEDYEWVMGVNLWGVIHGIRTFVPILLEQDEPGHVINTASMAALTNMPYSGIYFMTKHAVLSLSETLYHELTLRGAKVGVTAVCPEVVATRIDDSERNRPEGLQSGEPRSQERELVETALRKSIVSGVPPDWIADRAVDAMTEGRFYVLSEDDWRRTAETRLEDIRLARNPTFAPPVPG